MASGVKILAENEGEGPIIAKGDSVDFESQGFLSRGECVQNRLSSTIRVGQRRVISGIEYALQGMKAGGYRKVRISPHLAYREEGVPEKIPPNAVLVYELWVTKVIKRESAPSLEE